METIKKKLTVLKQTLKVAEDRAKQAEDELAKAEDDAHMVPTAYLFTVPFSFTWSVVWLSFKNA